MVNRKQRAHYWRRCDYGKDTSSTGEYLTRRMKANDRERDRMHALNDALELLRTVLPVSTKKNDDVISSSTIVGCRMSKIEILRSAIHYIRCLTEVLSDADGRRTSNRDLRRTVVNGHEPVRVYCNEALLLQQSSSCNAREMSPYCHAKSRDYEEELNIHQQYSSPPSLMFPLGCVDRAPAASDTYRQLNLLKSHRHQDQYSCNYYHQQQQQQQLQQHEINGRRDLLVNVTSSDSCKLPSDLFI